MRILHNLAQLPWQLAGYTPYQWRIQRSMEINASPAAEIPAIPAHVPGSVQAALHAAGLLPDWNIGLNARSCEWVEHRHWIFQTHIPTEWLPAGKQVRLHCLGLDYEGYIRLNGQDVGQFRGTFTPHVFDLTPHLGTGVNVLQLVFTERPNWLGQFGYTSQMTAWKPRFNYTWDWTSRLVQIGIWDDIFLTVTDGEEIIALRVRSDLDAATQAGCLHIAGAIGGGQGTAVRLTLSHGDTVLRQDVVSSRSFRAGCTLDNLPVKPWWPNLAGDQPLYHLTCDLLDAQGQTLDSEQRRVGFRHVAWEPCVNAPADADPWLCVINGQPTFLQGVNWTPIRPNFADVDTVAVEKQLRSYANMGCNILRVWGGAYLERQHFYDLCDELGLLVWQEFPLSSSGIDNWPPEDSASIQAQAAIAESYILRRQHHPALILWCGGNELQGSLDGQKTGSGKPVDCSHPLIAALAQKVATLDPERRFLATSSSGPRFTADARDFGKGLHWDVHGPWSVSGSMDDWRHYWEADDALFRSETGCPGSSPAELIEQYKGECSSMPCSLDNPLWRRTGWWVEWDQFVHDVSHTPSSLEEYVAWSQERQAQALTIAVSAVKKRFPATGGIILWMGHDCFPCTANTSIFDFHGNPKPAAVALKKVFHSAIGG